MRFLWTYEKKINQPLILIGKKIKRCKCSTRRLQLKIQAVKIQIENLRICKHRRECRARWGVQGSVASESASRLSKAFFCLQSARSFIFQPFIVLQQGGELFGLFAHVQT